MKPKIAFVTGGFSGEAEISYKSAITFEKNIDKERYELYKIDITIDGWFYELKNGDKIEVNKNDFSILIEDETITFDAVLIGIHGTPGEDGKLQGYFDMLHIPYTSCDCATSALTFNKRYTVAVAGASGINVSNSILLFKQNFQSPDELVRNLKFPVFVKPNNGGSSIGMSKVNAPSEELGKAIEKAFKEDDQVLVEEFIEGREFTIGVFKAKGEIIALPITEVISKNDFFDFEAKYHGASNEVTPAKIDDSVSQLVRDNAIKVYRVFNCKGIIRIDFIYNEKEQKLYMLEINTVPGQSEASIVPQQLKILGWSLKEFYTALIEECLHN
ncbi:D-alanine--D-alanine ligase [Ginsengibacter hankyongi]|uniref:D-alanine--D-alanine ligase n=1 Tax=Ginsengibacter hankyongi TaxID=2607284 RepID=A0A5J5IEJ3_9BACT|nr:D-alanine--D-alanine ligase [Ginsengibacter hankyongi]KAA9036576.1 D-alanine--D-alanine ligase [Ginsengibacter hankyongi]